jgi:type II secretory pathway pseudopilin PulG
LIDITTIINALIALLGVIITAVLIPLIRTHTTAVQREQIQSWVNIAVVAAEQIYKGSGRGVEKKNYVLEFLNQHGLTYNETSIDALIESSVKLLNIAQDNSNKDSHVPDFDDLK